MKTYRLPGTTEITTSVENYLAEWKRYGGVIEKLLPGAKLYGFDPGFSFIYENNVIDVPLEIIKAVEKLFPTTDNK